MDRVHDGMMPGSHPVPQNRSSICDRLFHKTGVKTRYNQRVLRSEAISTSSLAEDTIAESRVTAIDEGDPLKELIKAENSLLANNFPQAVLTVACWAIGANNEPIWEKVICQEPQLVQSYVLKRSDIYYLSLLTG